MSTQFDTAWEGIEQSWANGQLAHAYLLRGAPHGAAGRFADKLLNLIYGNHPQVQNRTHLDVFWVEPESKSRQIRIGQIKYTKSDPLSDPINNLVTRFSQSAFSGGWKVAVILNADRMTDPAANALLKTLEEPPAKSILLLISNEPQSLLPTISSRCQRINLTAEDEEVSKHWNGSLLDILSGLPPADAPQVGLLTGRLVVLLNELKKEFEADESERLPEDLPAKEAKALLDGRAGARLVGARADILRTMLKWQRDVLLLVLKQDESTLHFPEAREALEHQAIVCSRAEALKRINAVEEAGRQLGHNLPAELVFENFFSQMVG